MSKTKKIRNIIFIALMALINAFIIFEASLPGGLSSLHSGKFSNVIGGIINDNVEVDQSFIDVETITLKNISNDENIIIGTTKRLDVELTPSKASNKAITYVSEPTGIVNVVNNGLTCYVEALGKPNQEVTVKAISHNNKVSEVKLKLIDKLKPTEFITNTDMTLPLHTSKAIDINFSENNDVKENFKALIKYNPNLLNITSDNLDVAKISHGYVKAVGVGTANIKVDDKHSFKVTVEPNDVTPVLPNDDFAPTLEKDNIFNKDLDYIDDHYTELGSKINVNVNSTATDKNFAYKSLTPLTCLVNQDGRVFGSKMAGKGKIEVTSIASGVSKILEFDVKDVMPSAMEVNIHGRKDLAIGQSFSISGNFTAPFNFSNSDIIVSSNNNEVASIGPMGRLVRVTALAVGDAKITVKSVANPNLEESFNVSFTKKTAINDENKNAFEGMIRKAIGHFSLFFVDGIFTTLMFIFTLENKKYYKRHRAGLISLGTGFGVAWLSEFIQIFVKRGPSISDVMLDFSGFLIATIIVTGIFMIIDKIKANKERRNDDEKI